MPKEDGLAAVPTILGSKQIWQKFLFLRIHISYCWLLRWVLAAVISVVAETVVSKLKLAIVPKSICFNERKNKLFFNHIQQCAIEDILALAPWGHYTQTGSLWSARFWLCQKTQCQCQNWSCCRSRRREPTYAARCCSHRWLEVWSPLGYWQSLCLYCSLQVPSLVCSFLLRRQKEQHLYKLLDQLQKYCF